MTRCRTLRHAHRFDCIVRYAWCLFPAELDLDRLRGIAAAYPDVDLVVVFGSVARRDPRPWSDVDVAMSGGSFWRMQTLAAEIGRAVGRDADVVDLDTASDLLRYRVAAEGVLLREALRGTWARFQADSALRWFDLEPLVALCAAGARKRLREEAGHG